MTRKVLLATVGVTSISALAGLLGVIGLFTIPAGHILGIILVSFIVAMAIVHTIWLLVLVLVAVGNSLPS